MKTTVIAAAAAIALGAFAGAALAQAKPEVLVKQRQAAMTLIGKYFGPLGAMAQGKAPFNAQTVQRNADYLAALSQMPWDGFHASTAGEKSRAKPELFKETQKVNELAERLQSEVKQLQTLAKGGDEAAIKAQIGAVGKACGACHDAYREKQ
ncbi:MAG TPA: cytochrome c [Burkholderiales bacterium]|nr:cytochrome c [Burkholderiales bacterium]